MIAVVLQKLSRKLVHASAGPILLLFWTAFRSVTRRPLGLVLQIQQHRLRACFTLNGCVCVYVVTGQFQPQPVQTACGLQRGWFGILHQAANACMAVCPAAAALLLMLC